MVRPRLHSDGVTVHQDLTPDFQLLGICCLWYLLPAEHMPNKGEGLSGVGTGRAINAAALYFYITLIINKDVTPGTLKKY